MKTRIAWAGFSGAIALLTLVGSASAQSNVSFGRITAVNMVTQDSGRSQAGGALLGGAIGMRSGSGQSSSNRALRTVGGAAAGQQVGRISGRSQAFEYTVLVDGTTTVRMVSDEAGLRIGDCVAVERGNFNNLRLVTDERCAPARAGQTAAAPATPAAVQEATACDQAKEQLLAAATDEDFDRAERRVRVLCSD